MEFTDSSFNKLNENGDEILGIKLAPYNPTNYDAIDLSFSSHMLNLQSDDILYDLGSGDGRLKYRIILYCGSTPFL